MRSVSDRFRQAELRLLIRSKVVDELLARGDRPTRGDCVHVDPPEVRIATVVAVPVGPPRRQDQVRVLGDGDRVDSPRRAA
jgi:hypothetical protein